MMVAPAEGAEVAERVAAGMEDRLLRKGRSVVHDLLLAEPGDAKRAGSSNEAPLG